MIKINWKTKVVEETQHGHIYQQVTWGFFTMFLVNDDSGLTASACRAIQV